MGFGALINVTKKDLLLEDLDLGVALGYWQFKGAKSNIESSYMIPLMGTAGYRFELFPLFTINPKIAAGFSYNSISYKYDSGVSVNKQTKSRSGVEPLALAGLWVNYGILDYWFVSAGADYGIIYETGGTMNFLAINISAGRKF